MLQARRFNQTSNAPLFCFYVFGQMGLGKTLQAISILSYLKIYRVAPGPFCMYAPPCVFAIALHCHLHFDPSHLIPAVVLCPLSVTDGWLSEFARFSPSLRAMQYVGDKVHRRHLRRTMHGDVFSTSSDSDVGYSSYTCSFSFSTTLDPFDMQNTFSCFFFI